MIDLLSLEVRGPVIFAPFFSNGPGNQIQAGASCDGCREERLYTLLRVNIHGSSHEQSLILEQSLTLDSAMIASAAAQSSVAPLHTPSQAGTASLSVQRN